MENLGTAIRSGHPADRRHGALHSSTRRLGCLERSRSARALRDGVEDEE